MPYNGNSFNWDQSRWDTINQLVHDASKEMRLIRPLLKLYGKQGDYVERLPGHTLDEVDPAYSRPLSINSYQNVRPVKIACEFKLSQEQFYDEDAVHTLAIEAAYRVAQAEDAVILRGAKANTDSFLDKLNVTVDHLPEQGLFQTAQPQPEELPPLPLPVSGAAPVQIPDEKSILAHIVQGISDLQKNGRYSKYASIVGLGLYEQAMKPRGGRSFSAEVYEIRLLLVENGFVYCPAAPDRAGVIFSLSGDGIKIAVPVDARVEFVEEKRDVTLRVVEQIALLVDVPKAVAALRKTPGE